MFAAIIASRFLKRKYTHNSLCLYGYQHLADRPKYFMETDPEALSRYMSEINNRALRQPEPELETAYAKAG